MKSLILLSKHKKTTPPKWQITPMLDELQLTFHLPEQHLYRLHQERESNSGRQDGLWKSSCFELFLATGQESYREYNFCWDGSWQCYDFDSYRSPQPGRRPDVTSPRIQTSKDRLVVTIKEKMSSRFNVAVILEDLGGELLYFSIKKYGDTPDFHHPQSFITLTDTEQS